MGNARAAARQGHGEPGTKGCARDPCCGAAPQRLALLHQTCCYSSELLPAIPEHGNGFSGACRAEEGVGHSSAHFSHAHSSWTEDTRAQIFSEGSSGHGLPETPCEELERRIEGKLKEFEALAASGQQLVSEEHYLSATVRTGQMRSGKPSEPPKILCGQEGTRCGCRAPASEQPCIPGAAQGRKEFYSAVDADT